jgi:hypothetical protein
MQALFDYELASSHLPDPLGVGSRRAGVADSLVYVANAETRR